MNEDTKTVHETLIHLSNVYFSTRAECGVTAQQRHVNAPLVVLKEQGPVSHPVTLNYN